MLLKKGIDYTAFIQTVQKCKADVYYISGEGDRLNLRSALCKYLFISVLTHKELLEGGMVECLEESDYILLDGFLEDDNGKYACKPH